MPTYNFKIVKGKRIYLRPDLLDRWLDKHEGEWFSDELVPLGKSADPKTAEQLGYYWGLLIPEICDELVSQGHTYTIRFASFEREVPYNKLATHETLTALCGRVGDDGAAIRLSDMSLHQTMRFIDNVLAFAIVQLNMNGEALKARRPTA